MRGPPARLPWMNVYSKPEFTQKYNVLPDISHARKEMEDDLEDNTDEYRIDMQHEFSDSRIDVGMKDSHNTIESNMVRHLENSTDHFQEGLRYERGGVHYGLERRTGSADFTNAISPYNQEFQPMKITNTGMNMNIIGSNSCVGRKFITSSVQDLALYGKKSVLPGISRKSHMDFEKPEGVIKRAQSSNEFIAQVPENCDTTLVNPEKICREPKEIIKVEFHEENQGSILDIDHIKTGEDTESKSPDFSVGLTSDNMRNNCREADDVEIDSKFSYSTSSIMPENKQGHITVDAEKWAAILTDEHVEERNKDDTSYHIDVSCTCAEDNGTTGLKQEIHNSRHLDKDSLTDPGNGKCAVDSPRVNTSTTSQSLQGKELNSSQAKRDESNEYPTVLDSFTERFNADLTLMKETVNLKVDFPDPKEQGLETVYDSRDELNMQCQENENIGTTKTNNKTETEIHEIKDSEIQCAEERQLPRISKTDGEDRDIVNDECQRSDEKDVVDINEKQESDLHIFSSKDSKGFAVEDKHSYRDLEKQKMILVDPESVKRQHRKRKSIRQNLIDPKICISQSEASSTERISSSEHMTENSKNSQSKVRKESVLYETDDDIDNISDSILDNIGDNNTECVKGSDKELTGTIHFDINDGAEQDRNIAATDDAVDTKPLKKVTFASKIDIYDIKQVESCEMEHSESSKTQISTGNDTYNTDSDFDQISDRILDDDGEVKFNYDVHIKEKDNENSPDVLRIVEFESKSTKPKNEDINALKIQEVEEARDSCNAPESHKNCNKIKQDDHTTELGKHGKSAKIVIKESNEEYMQKEKLRSLVAPATESDFDNCRKDGYTKRVRKYKKSMKSAIKNKLNDKSMQNEKVESTICSESNTNHVKFMKNDHTKTARKREKSVKEAKEETRHAIQPNEKKNKFIVDDKGKSKEKQGVAKTETDNYMKRTEIEITYRENPRSYAKKKFAPQVRHERKNFVRQDIYRVQNSYRIKSPVRSEIYLKIMNILETKIGREKAAELMRSKTIKDMLRVMTKEPMRYGLSYAYIVKFREENIYLDLNKLIDDPTMVYYTNCSKYDTLVVDWNVLKVGPNVEYCQTVPLSLSSTNTSHNANTMKTTKCNKDMTQSNTGNCTKSNDPEKQNCKKTSKLKSFLKKFICVFSSRVDNDDDL